MDEQAKEELGLAIDRVGNLVGALQLPFAAETHVEHLSAALPEVLAELKAAFVKLTGENPWD